MKQCSSIFMHLMATAAIAALGCGPLEAQAFEVVSIKPARPFTPNELAAGTVHRGVKITAPRVDIGFANLEVLIALAYQVERFQVISPVLLVEQPFDILATMPDGATKEQLPAMLQSMLAERFALRVHRERKSLPVYVLEVGKQGPNLAKAEDLRKQEKPKGLNKNTVSYAHGETIVTATEGDRLVMISGPDGDVVTTKVNDVTRMKSPGMTMEVLAKWLSSLFNRPVVNRTGLDGRFRIALDYATKAPTTVGGSLRKLGLTIEHRLEPIDAVVVDSVQKMPTEN
jgi:uncharacterized protein (TIGR03435 family)